MKPNPPARLTSTWAQGRGRVLVVGCYVGVGRTASFAFVANAIAADTTGTRMPVVATRLERCHVHTCGWEAHREGE